MSALFATAGALSVMGGRAPNALLALIIAIAAAAAVAIIFACNLTFIDCAPINPYLIKRIGVVTFPARLQHSIV
jgi:hypothetical protein